MRAGALLILVSTALPVRSADAIRPGRVELYPTYSAVGIEIAYEGDDNRNATASFQWRKKGEKRWLNGVELTVDRKRRLMWGSIWPLEQGDEIEVRVGFVDPDAGKLADVEERTGVRKVWNGDKPLRTLHVSVTGDDAADGSETKPLRTLARAGAVARPGDLVVVHDGTYAEGNLFQRLRGEPGRPIVFVAARGAKPVLDSSTVIKDGKWKQEGDVWSIPFESADPPGYVAQDGKRMFHYPSLDDLRQCKLKACRAWFHDAKTNRLHVRTGGEATPDKLVYNVSRHDYGLWLTGSRHVVVRGLTFQNYGNVAVRISEGARGCMILDGVIRRCTGGIFLKGEDTCDNAVWRNEIVEEGLMDFPWQLIKNGDRGRQGIFCVAGRGNSFCHNRIAGWFDCICPESWKNPDKLALNRDCDVMFNELSDAGDDAVEADGGGVNMRIHGNTIRQCHTALSLAPIERGPVYVTRNDATFFNLFFKLNVGGCTSLGWTYCWHNSGYCLVTGPDGGTGISFPPDIPCANKVFLNNVLVCNEWSVRACRDDCVLDANCYFHVPRKTARKFQVGRTSHPSIAAFSKATGHEKKGMYLDPRFVATPDVGKYAALDPQTQSQRDLFLPMKTRPGDLHLRAGSPCIDRGIVIRGFNEEFEGKGPDLGAHEGSARK